MPLFVTSVSSSNPHGVYAMSNPPPAAIQAPGTGNAIIVGQFPWGPSEQLTYPGSDAQRNAQFAPAGMTRTGSAVLSTLGKAWPQMGVVRVADTSAGAAATAAIQTSGSVTVLTLTASSIGTQGNSLMATTSAPSDGVSGHFNLTVSVSSASGTTQEVYPNINVTGTGTQVLPNVTNSVLLGSATSSTTGTPAFGNTTFSGGSNGTVTAAMYVGTPGNDDKGFALLEADDTIDFVFTDDPGNSFRATVNAGLDAHGILTTNRVVILSGNSGQTAAAAQTDVASYRGINSVYTDPWAYVADDTTGATWNQPGASWAASVMSQLPPSVSPAWKATFVSGMMAGITQLESNRTAARAQNTAAGIMTLIPGAQGGVVFEAGVNTSLTAGQQNITRTRMGIYLASGAVESWYPYVDAPNVPFFQQDLVNSWTAFLNQLEQNAKINPAVLPYIVAYDVLNPKATNTAASIANNQYVIGTSVQTGSDMSQIYLNMSYGPTVTVSAG
jgi:hypothetical protein